MNLVVHTDLAVETECFVEGQYQYEIDANPNDDWLSADQITVLRSMTINDIHPRLRKQFDREWELQGNGVLHEPSKSEKRIGTNNQLLALFLKDVEAHPLLTATGEKQLAYTIGGDDIERAVWARDTFIKTNLRMVVGLANKLPETANVNVLDHIQEGVIGLEHAVMKFDPRRGLRFSTMSENWIRQAMAKNRLRNSTGVQLPTEEARVCMQLLHTYGSDMFLQAARRDSPLSVTAPDHATRERYGSSARFLSRVSLNAPVNDGDNEASDYIVGTADTPNIERIMIVRALRDARSRIDITDEELECFYFRFFGNDGDGMTIPEIMDIVGLTRETTVRRIRRVVEGLHYVLDVAGREY